MAQYEAIRLLNNAFLGNERPKKERCHNDWEGDGYQRPQQASVERFVNRWPSDSSNHVRLRPIVAGVEEGEGERTHQLLTCRMVKPVS